MGVLHSGWLSCRRNGIAAASELMPDLSGINKTAVLFYKLKTLVGSRGSSGVMFSYIT